MTSVPRVPLELYGFNTIPPHEGAIRGVREQLCPFTAVKCWKTRKSDSSQSIGTCVVGQGGSPQMTCPTRFLADPRQIFDDTRHLLSDAEGLDFALAEVKIPEFGTVDYMVMRTSEGAVTDFYGLEVQTLDTTGSVWGGRVDFERRARVGMSEEWWGTYKYNINWKMNAKLVLIQTAHKASVFESWGKKFVWVMQDTLLARMQSAFDFSGFRDESPNDSVLFYGYEMVPGEDRYSLRLKNRIGGDLGSVERAMSPKSAIGEELYETTLESLLRRKENWVSLPEGNGRFGTE